MRLPSRIPARRNKIVFVLRSRVLISRTLLFFFCILGVAASHRSYAYAADVSGLFKEAEKAYEEKNYVGCLSKLGEITRALDAEAPLEIQRMEFIQSEPAGFGQIQIRPEGVFKAGEAMLVYLEPRHYTVLEKDALKQTIFKLDYRFVNEKNVIAMGIDDFGEYAFRSESALDPIFITFSPDGSKLPPGSYHLDVTLRDPDGVKQASASKSFQRE